MLGVNVMLIVQLAPAANVVPQVDVRAKLLELVPVSEMLVIVIAALPVLVSVTTFALLVVLIGWMPKARLPGERLAAGAAPVPVSATVCGLPAALSLVERDAVRAPAALGVNVILMLHVAFAAKVEPHVVVRAKLEALVPVREMLLIVMLAVPVLVNVTMLAVLVVFTN